LLAAIGHEEVDAGLAGARRGAERLCIVTRVVKPVDEMIRFVVAPDGKVVPDLDRKLPGRGAWVTATRAATVSAVEGKAFARVFRGKGTTGAELVDLIERLLEKAALEALSLANKAGCVVTGFVRVETALQEQHVVAVLHASDAAPDGVRKLEAVARIAETRGRPRPIEVNALRGEQMDLALGRSNVVHAALLSHPASEGFLARFLRLARWRGDGPAAGVMIAGGGRVRR
jgi:predicted RNA-binding protein YlxR (DUF448 family)